MASKISTLSWTTEHEIKFVKYIGTWGEKRSGKKTKLELLNNYLASTWKRKTFGEEVDKNRLITFIQSEIEAETKRMASPKLPAAKTSVKRKK